MPDLLTHQKLFEAFEPELLNELSQCDLMDLPAGSNAGVEGMHVDTIPVVVEGDIKVYKTDNDKRDSTIYHIRPGESCVISITKGFRSEKSPSKAIALIDTKIYAVPKEKSNEWLQKYPSWRQFVIELYNRRIEELITQHQQVTAQKDDISFKNEQILESIRYARRIQQAVLPQKDEITQLGSKNFIFYRPKDIVSGDFYWTKKDGDKLYIAIADATGHGVPGAFMSMLGISLMTEIAQNEIKTAANFLNQLRVKVKEALRQSDYSSATKDGMDVSFCMVDLRNRTVQFAGAYNPLYRFSDGKFIEIKADKMPIGIHFREKGEFTNHQFDLKEGDMFYMFSDGFADQLGGPNDKKYKTKNFKEFLAKIHTLPTTEQEELVKQEFENWKGGKSQVDDVLIFGARIENQ